MHGRADGMLKIRRSRIFRFALSGVSEIYFGPGDSHLVLALRRNKPDRVPCTQYSVSEFHTGGRWLNTRRKTVSSHVSQRQGQTTY